LAELSGILQRQHAAQHPETFKPYDGASGISFFRDQLARSGVAILVGQAAHTAVGYLMAEAVAHEDTPFTSALTALHIQHLVVDVDFRRQGVGQALLAEAEQEANRRGCAVLQLACWSFNEAAQAYFAANGFAPYQVRMTRPAR
jgi:ribosomal protein S18 acetylase RimI-like enzyme